MHDDDIPVKTQVGLAEIKSRALGLPPRMRTALLLVDGVKSVRELEQLLAASGVKPGALQTLLEKRLISAGDNALIASNTVSRAEKPAATEAPAIAQEPAARAEALITKSPPLPDQPGTTVTVAAEVPSVAPAPATVKVAASPPAPKVSSASEAALATPPLRTSVRLPSPEQKPAPKAVPVAAEKSKPAPTVKSARSSVDVPFPTLPAIPAAAPVAPTAPVMATQAFPHPIPARGRQEPLLVDQEEDEEPDSALANFIQPPPPEDMKLLAARAHVASALDDRVDGYVLRQMVASCSSRAELLSLFDAADRVLKKSMGSTGSAQVLNVARTLLHS
jgi:hypothetical protein